MSERRLSCPSAVVLSTNVYFASKRCGGHRLSGLLRAVLPVVALLGLCAAGVHAKPSSSGNTYTVTDLGDTGAGTGYSGDLRYAITQADTDTGDFIVFQSGLTGTITLGSALPTISTSMTITGPTSGSGATLTNLVTVDGGNSSHIFFVAGVQNVSIANLNLNKGNTVPGYPGNALTNLGTLTVTNVNISGNSASIEGGAVGNKGTLTVTNSTFSKNSADYGGGAIFNDNSSTLTVTGSTFSQNSGGTSFYGGGAILNFGTATVRTSTFSQNSSPNSDGGAIVNESKLTVIDSTFSQNSAKAIDGEGGAIYNQTNSTGMVINSTFFDNAALYGGAIFNNSAITVTNSTFSGNQAFLGGAIYNTSGMTLTATNNIFSGNSATSAGGSIIADNDITEDHNVFYNNQNDYLALSSSDQTGNPNLATLGWYGGLTQTMILLPGSAAICAGSSTYLAPTFTGLSSAISNDQRGFTLDPTCQSGAVDAGAVQTNQYQVNTLADLTDGSCTSAACSLRDAITAADVVAGDITFATGLTGTITLGTDATTGDNPLPGITGTANLLGPGAKLLTISANKDPNVSWVFIVGDGANAFFYGATIANGYSGIASGGIITDGTVTVANCIFSNNITAGGLLSAGGALFNNTDGTLTVTDSSFSGNSSTTSAGGAIMNEGVMTVTNSTFSANSAYGSGGAIANSPINGSPGTLTVTNSTIYGNSAKFGGGIANGGTLTVTNSTIYGNSASNGGGIYNFSVTTTLSNSILAGNTSGNGPDGYGAFDDGGYNLIGDGTAITGITNGTNNDQVGVTASPINPLLSSLGNYGGPTQTMFPLSGSAALNAGQYQTGDPTTDQRGAHRPYTSKASIDIGAVQITGNPPMIGSISPNSGPAAGGTLVTITGSGLDTASAISFGGTSASFTTIPVSGTTPAYLAATSPQQSAGTVDVTVTNASGTSATSAADQFTYIAPPSISAVSPDAGPPAGGTIVIITGTNLTGATSVKFGTSTASSFTVNSATQITATAPAASAGTVDITVTGPDGTSAISASDQYTYDQPPAITSGNSATFTVGTMGSFTATATGNPAPSLSETGALPSGVVFIDNGNGTATLSGTPAAGTSGSYPLTIKASNGASPNATQSFTLTVNPVLTTTTLGVSTGTGAPGLNLNVTPGQSVMLTATVASIVSAAGTPIGTVSFYDGATLLNATPAKLSGGVATYSTSALAPGVTHTLAATYNGSTDYLTSSTTASATVTVAPLEFTMTLSGPSSQTVVPGGMIVYTVNVTPDYGSYAGTVNFTVSGLPPDATVTFSPKSITANGGPQTITVTIQTAAVTAMLHASPPTPSAGSRLTTFALAFLLLFGAGSMRRRGKALRRMLCVIALLAGGAASVMLSGCGGGINGFFAQSPHNYTITITATAGGLTQIETVTLNVQ